MLRLTMIFPIKKPKIKTPISIYVGNTYNYSRNQSYPLDVRLANFILLTSQNGYYREKHTESSEFLGVTYRHLLYVLADFVKRGILTKTNSGYYISNLAALQKLAHCTQY